MTASITPVRANLGIRPRRAGALLAIILVSYFMIVLDNSIVFTGLARVRDELDFSTAGLSWVQTAYALVFGGFLLLGARAGDLLGRRRMFVVGLVVFSAASLAIGLAPTAEFLIAARAVQGLGSAILAPTALALLTAGFAEGPERTRAVAAYGSVAGLGASFGLVLGGILADFTSWRVGFLLNVPIGAVLIAAAMRVIVKSDTARGRFDLAGALTSTLGIGLLVYAITRTAESGWSDPITLSLIGLAALMLGAFVAIETRARQPILPLRVLADRTRAGAFIARMLFAGAIFGYFFFISQYMQSVLGFTPVQAGLAFLPMTIVQFAASTFVSRLTRRFGNPALVVVGLTITASGMLWLSLLDIDSTYWAAVGPPMILLGLGQGIGFAPLTAAGITAIESRDAGAASGVVNVAHQLGGALGVSVMVAVAAADTRVPATAAGIAAETSAGITTGALLLCLALIAALTLITPWRRFFTRPSSPSPYERNKS
ncbi:MFS transporter [Microbacterium pygmaeum]|uniref:Drug resistance transporter, EmrB/QacA subfamily n=1 Tax=Microbacterium pygmaeum TaxID=370764 RepID=A0A1G7X7B4_9MICO|nr:MFS transporter [Microbacterium pygmaeum]SDG80054.1 drug resistance transporter, EmrB/QacA subfamily [Microbacterium pygmaeum]